ncbi:MAG: glycosyltransferase [Marinilabiliaceae bacterium]|nr:glycosyltransferase [Marinilabiliaceae bacterium]
MPQLESLGYHVKGVSDKKNQVMRLIDMLISTVRYSRKTDFVLIDTYSYKGFIYAAVLSRVCRLLKLSYVPILRGGNLPVRLERSPNECRRIFTRSYINVAPSYYLLSEFEKRGYTACFIPNNIDIGQYPFKQRSAVAPRLVYVRSFDAIYNPQMAIEVLKILLVIYPDARLCMVGPDKDGTLAKCRQLAQEYDLTDKIEFTGMLSKKEWHKRSENYDIFINTTNIDNTPVSVIEALALGLPVVSTNVGGIPYLLENKNDALLVERQDVNGMVAAIEKLLDSEELVLKLSLNGRKKAESFDWHNVKTKWQNLLSNHD